MPQQNRRVCPARKIGMAQKDLQLFFEERIELQKFFDRRDDADRIGLQLFGDASCGDIVMVFDLGLEIFADFTA